jgi:hypothetical protein
LVLFVAYGGGHVAMLLPVAKQLESDGFQVLFLALTTARAVLKMEGLPSIGFADLPEAADAESRKWGEELIALMPEGEVSRDESIAYLGANFRDLVAQYGEIEARRLYEVKGRHAFLPVATLTRVLERLNPQVVVATNSPRTERAAIISAGKLGIPSVCAVDMFALKEVAWIGKPGYGTRVCVLNEAVREMFLRSGRNANEIVVTGNPAFDALSSKESIDAGKKYRDERGWSEKDVIILWASQVEPQLHPFAELIGNPSLPRLVEQELRRLVANDNSLRLLVRYHPSERVQFIADSRVEFSPLTESISIVLNAVDVVVVTASTVGLQAAMAGRPVLSVDMSVFTADTLYADNGISHGVKSIENIGSALRALLAVQDNSLLGTKSFKNSTYQMSEVVKSLIF